MQWIADRLDLIQPSPSISAMNRAKALIAEGQDVCNMAAGEPDFPTPPFIIEAAHKALLAGETRYTAVDGTLALKRAICEKFSRENGLAVTPHQVSVGAGAKQVLYNAFTCSVNPGDEVIVPAPYWVSYPDIVKLNGGKPVFIPTDAARGFKISAAQLRAAIGPRTKWLVLNSPNNPSGAIYTEDELRGLGEELARHPHVRVLTDDIYEHVRYDDVPYATFAQVNPRLADRTLTVNGVSKTFAMTGWRIGYAAGPRDLIKAMEKLQSQTSGNPAAVSQAAAIAALQAPLDFFEAWRAEYQRRRDYIVRKLDGQHGLACPTPAGAFYVYPSCAAFIGKRTPAGKVIENDSDFVMYLLDEFKVATVQGAAYGVSPAFRISFATSMDVIEKACQRILEACRALT
ncbi:MULTISPECIES: pyridoxal phosphate-dependent aminotransferase [unclassified Achromobacter]|uniref:pyridoxal phosphate-dependent aminotransferase n=1 Tax=unclassified Achromobacter TaxID=2626865 RepID=UPI000B51C6CB|nr:MULTISPECIES: pyridoxal phosphate-dependent aminotransferase [unclassified Achromobacter]OWT77406.1 aspartate aminotransferase [Achromobacter sp. HZ28]OWT78287.1 aspartate aminotransferase [Achromobacter sp. HZ34]